MVQCLMVVQLIPNRVSRECDGKWAINFNRIRPCAFPTAGSIKERRSIALSSERNSCEWRGIYFTLVVCKNVRVSAFDWFIDIRVDSRLGSTLLLSNWLRFLFSIINFDSRFKFGVRFSIFKLVSRFSISILDFWFKILALDFRFQISFLNSIFVLNSRLDFDSRFVFFSRLDLDFRFQFDYWFKIAILDSDYWLRF